MPMLSKKAIIRKAQELIERANEIAYENKQEATGAMQIIAAILTRTGGSFTITEQELAGMNGALGFSRDEQAGTITIELLIPKEESDPQGDKTLTEIIGTHTVPLVTEEVPQPETIPTLAEGAE